MISLTIFLVLMLLPSLKHGKLNVYLYQSLQQCLCSSIVFASKSNHHGRNMGGVVVFVKHKIAKFFTRLDLDLKHGIVLKIKSGIINAYKDTLYLTMYIPPEGSQVYNNADVKGIDIIEELLTKNYNNNVDLMITGDLNARTA